MSDLILLDEDLGKKFFAFIEMSNVFFKERDIENYNNSHIDFKAVEEVKLKPYLIVVNDKAIIFNNELTPSQVKMIQLTELFIEARAKGIAIQNGWVKGDFSDIEKMGSKKMLNFKLLATQQLKYIFLFHMEFISSEMTNTSYNSPVKDFIFNIASFVSSEATKPISAIISRILNDDNVKKEANNALKNFWESATKHDDGAIFDISSAWNRNGSIAKTIGASSSHFTENSWSRFLLSKVNDNQKFYSAAFAFSFMEHAYNLKYENPKTHEMESWEKHLEDILSRKNANYLDSLDSTDLFFD